MKKKIPPLYIEHVKDSVNLYYLSLIEYKRENYLSIIDNITDHEVSAFVLDYANQERINMVNFLSLVTNWFYKSAHLYPLSFELSKYGLTQQMSPLYRTFDKNFISRIVGHPFSFDMAPVTKVKRRKVTLVPSTVEIHLKR